MQERAHICAAEGITFSGKEDCRGIALWRSSYFDMRAEGAMFREEFNLSGKRTEQKHFILKCRFLDYMCSNFK